MKFSKNDTWKIDSLETYNETYAKYPIKDLKVHKMASMNPMMNQNQYDALRGSIEEVGQRQPIVIWRGQIIDGRNRTKALAELGSKTVNVIELPYNYTIEQIRSEVLGSENRRHQTEAQRAIQAWSMWKGRLGNNKEYRTAREAANEIGVSKAYVEKAEWIAKRRGEEILHTLFDTGSCVCCGREVKNLATLQSVIKRDDDENAEAALKSSIEPITNEDKVTINAFVKMISNEKKEVILEIAKKLYATGKEL
ncbi:hypothetical protein DRO03_11735 [Methanosarcinales archaeon]|nr:MAG: hypothetical protein DRO03_11735 [Methanosarcinales archaeon]